ncbi:MAG: hypothetical protein A2270_10940 [Elusimicrobia bacterium RIFOXYA12_FULL_51_18]|nr:MAG: hypothetical protein A2270_10940 [Elusimicrobia bacterium RIFOXYA12_FULL_51_18]OGS32295.1 MAG: hypothetical protein A2218_02780 [Elusimicrobia bacterium RIFOXYA2_FULL_53_38]
MFAGLFLCAAVIPAFAQKNSREERELETISRELDKSAAKPEGAQRAAARIKAEFGVDDARVQGLRDKNMGYGEISIALGLAQGLPGGITDENVQKIMALRQGPPVMGWGKMAKDLGLKLGPVMSNMKKMSAKMRKQEKADKVKKEKGEKMEKPEKPGKPEKAEKMERPERPDKGGKR